MFYQQVVSGQIKTRSYTKVSQTLKQLLLDYVLHNGMIVKQAALILHINYAAAKTIINKVKKNKLSTNPNLNIKGKPCGIEKSFGKSHLIIKSILQEVLVQNQEFQ